MKQIEIFKTKEVRFLARYLFCYYRKNTFNLTGYIFILYKKM